MKIVMISDTHEKHNDIKLPAGDLLIHSGDLTRRGNNSSIINFLDWFSSQDFKYKVFIAGNHDWDFEHNPDKYSKQYDFIIKSFKFDLKGTRVPMKFKNSIKEVILNPQRIIDFYYEQQSRGRRLGMQNRLFVVTIDENNYSDELKLRLDFEVKKEAFEKYINNFDKNMNLFEFNYKDKILYSDIIFIIKNNEKISIKIASDLLN